MSGMAAAERSPGRTVGMLHTSPAHSATFERLVAEVAPTAAVRPVVDEGALALARRLGADHPAVRDHVAALLDRFDQLDRLDRSPGEVAPRPPPELVVCTCSTIGAVAEEIGSERGRPVVRVDRPVAERAVATGDRVGVLAALECTTTPTTELLRSVAAHQGREIAITVRLVPDAWERFEEGAMDAYLDRIAAELPELAAACDVIVLAQASMAGAVERAAVAVPVLSSPRIAVETLLG